MNFVEVKENTDIYKKTEDLFLRAFPPEERPPFKFFYMDGGRFKGSVLAIYDGETYVGLLITNLKDDLVYIYFLAIDDSVRSKGYGSQVLSAVKGFYQGKRLFLLAEEVDPRYEDYEHRKRREHFYLKNGFKNSKTVIEEFGVRYELFTLDCVVEPREFYLMMRDLVDEKTFRIGYKNANI
ncbi:MAG: GNAT family N-acetyltransferase [Bacilli bacterium]|nr:GNAT family N-acetyltransferase [Bacilli bacterium]